MTELIACLSTGKGTWGHVSRLIDDGKFSKVYLITNEFGQENFNKKDNTEFIVINQRQGLKELRDEIYNNLKEKINSKENEIALNIVSGEGKEHMALISALLKLGVGIRQMALTKNGIEEI
jgi:Na+-transporting NADH:ubiquinone oxidoreductase subunit NqrF